MINNRHRVFPALLTMACVGISLNAQSASGQSATGAAATTTTMITTTTTASPAVVPASPAASQQPQNLTTCMSELKETIRRMKGDSDDILHEVSRTQQVMPDGVAMDSFSNGVPPQLQGMSMVALDSMSHDVYLPPRVHWLNNSLAQLLDLQSKVQAETAAIAKIMADPECSSGARAQGMVLSDISTELGKDLGAIEVLIRETPPKNANLNLAAHKIEDTLSGMEKVCDRIWKEAPRKFKSR